MNRKPKIGVICLVRNTFDFNAAGEIYQRTMATLRSDDSIDWEMIEQPVMEPDETIQAAKRLSSAAVDGVAVISGTFHLGHLALLIHKYVSKPILLWAFPELPYNGGKIRLNSVCGINLNASNLYKAGVDDYCCNIAADIDQDWLNAMKIKVRLGEAHIGLAGYRAHGFFNLDVEDLSVFSRLGILVDHYELAEMFKTADSADFSGYLERLNSRYNVCGISGAQAEKVARLAASTEDFITRNALDALAVRCWPEFAATYGIAPCASMALLAAKGFTLGCEGDLEGTLSLLACRAISPEAPFMADLSQVSFEEDYALMWHCGVASDTLWDGVSDISADTYFAGGKGVTAGFVMKSGPVTIFRVDTARGKTRVFLQTGEAMAMKKELTGTYAKVRFTRNVKDLFSIVADKGIAHHVALLYGDHAEAFRRYSRIMGFEVIE